ncbi:hypothetical protein OAS19_01685 [Altererythrobacter sp.]|nr:hypothetical protein [Altererythrobacter sp.]
MNAIDRMYPALAEFYPALQGIGYDEKRGVIVVQVVGPDVAPIPIEISRSLPVETEIEALKGPIRPAAARGGTRLEQRGTDNLVCTAGFIGRNPSGTRGIVTAKHCDDSRAGPLEYQDGSTAYNVTFDAGLSRPVAEADIAFLTIPSSLSTLPQFFGNRNEAARNLTGRRTLSSTQARVTDGVAQGSVVCYYGMRTGPIVGQSCGEVTYKGYYEGQPGKAGYKVQIEGADLACNQGDSGGPVFAWNTAFGIVGGCDPYSSVKGGTDRMVYTSTDALYAYGYSLAY